ncbi:hypothetical protein HDU99_005579, partial [Rhizoclosmatium hyalinum]
MSEPSSITGTLLSTIHGRDRRSLRKIDKKDLLAAVKFGVKEAAYPCRATGATRLKYTFANIVYITDETSRREVTSYVLPIGIDRVPVSRDDNEMHAKWAATLKATPSMCTSHTVLVVDQSGSMRTSDVTDYRHRRVFLSDAVFGTIALDLVGKSLDSGLALPTNALSLIEFADTAVLTIDREPITNVLFNKLIDKRTEAKPRSHGNYQQALDLCDEILAVDEGNGACAILLLFLSDGKPSDQIPFSNSHEEIFGSQVRQLSEKFKNQLTVGTIGFAGEGTDFKVLEHMAKQASAGGSVGLFQKSQASSVALSSAVSLLGSKLSQTQTRLTALANTRLTGRGTLRVLETEGHQMIKNSSGLDGWRTFTNKVQRVEWMPDRTIKAG